MTARVFTSLLTLSWLTADAAPRVANQTINMPPAPPVSTIEVENAFTGLSFSAPLCLRSPAGETRRLFVCEKTGDLELVPDVTAARPSRTVFLNVDGIVNGRASETFRSNSEQGLLAVAFHPDYATNGHFFTVYNVRLGGRDYQRLSRWHDPDISDTVADPDSEEIFIEMRNDAGNHNGGDLHFGPDGYLYMSWGDEGNQNDSLNNGQFINRDFWSSITRIDVDLEPAELGTGVEDDDSVPPNPHPAIKLVGGNPLYEVPADNPWVGATSFNGVAVTASSVRTEFFAVGFRNPWRFSFDSETGELWVGDVGQGAWEEVATVAIGSNHGWAWYEGDANGPKFSRTINGASRTSATLTPPDWDYGHGNGEFQGNSVTGGFVYRGNNIPDLRGKYIFSDYTSGNIWALERTDTHGEPDVVRIAGEGGLAGFGPDPSNGDILMADVNGGQIHRLVARDVGAGFPPTLTDTGIFSDVPDLTPNPGVEPYDVNLPFWSDHAVKQRWFAIKNTVDKIGYSRDGAWSFPDGMVWVKHFDLELERGNPTTKKRIETRVLVRNQIGEVGDETVLVPEGANAKVLVPANSALEQTWYASDFDDASWRSAMTGIGYDENNDYIPLFGTGGNLGNDLNNTNASVYVRIPFTVADTASIDTLTLRMKYDDGFVAYLNGQRVTDSNPPGTLRWNSEASDQNPDGSATSFQDFDITDHVGLLQNGTNLLAIQGLNDNIGSSDMLVLPELVAGQVTFTESSYGVSYRWNDAGTAATLVGNAGESFDLDINTPDGDITQTWTIPSRASCNICHTPQAGHALSFNTRQLNRPGSHRGDTGNYLALLHDAGYLDTLPEDPASLPRHVAAHEDEYSLEARVRSYLDVNCAYCHQDPGTALPSQWLGNHHLALAGTGIINTPAVAAAQNPADRLVVPGSPERSIILNRVAATNGYTVMPPLATSEPDLVNIQLLTDWINQEASDITTYTAWRIANFGDAVSAEGEPGVDADGDSFTNGDEWLALTDPQEPDDYLELVPRFIDGELSVELPGLANRSLTVQHSSDLHTWTLWDAPGNDGIPRNPVAPQILSTPHVSPNGFLRVLIQQR